MPRALHGGGGHHHHGGHHGGGFRGGPGWGWGGGWSYPSSELVVIDDVNSDRDRRFIACLAASTEKDRSKAVAKCTAFASGGVLPTSGIIEDILQPKNLVIFGGGLFALWYLTKAMRKPNPSRRRRRARRRR